MAKTKHERIASIEEQIAQLENQRKQLIQKQKEDDRKARTRRLIERGAILESLIENADSYTNEQIKTLLERTIKTDFANKIIASLKQPNNQPTQQKTNPTGQPVTTHTTKTGSNPAGNRNQTPTASLSKGTRETG